MSRMPKFPIHICLWLYVGLAVALCAQEQENDAANSGFPPSSKSPEQLLPLAEAVVHPYGDDEAFLEKFKDLIENITVTPVYAPIMMMSIKW